MGNRLEGAHTIAASTDGSDNQPSLQRLGFVYSRAFRPLDGRVLWKGGEYTLLRRVPSGLDDVVDSFDLCQNPAELGNVVDLEHKIKDRDVVL